MCLVITFNSPHYDTTSIERYVDQSTTVFIYNVAWTSVIHGCMNLGSSKEIIGECKYMLFNQNHFHFPLFFLLFPDSAFQLYKSAILKFLGVRSRNRNIFTQGWTLTGARLPEATRFLAGLTHLKT